jgi:hypothetical protein
VVTATPEITPRTIKFITTIWTVLVPIAHQIVSQTSVRGPAKKSITWREGSLSTVGVRLVRAVCAVLLSITDPGERVAFTRSAGKLVTVTNGTVMG